MSQQIYTADEMGGEATEISSVSFFNTTYSRSRTLDVYMVHTNKTYFESNTDWIAVTEADRVFSGNVVMTKGYWTTIVLDTPFAYDGTSNLAIVIDDNMGYYYGGMACRVFNSQGYQSIRVYSDNTNYDPYNSSEYNGTRLSVKNQIILGIENGAGQTFELSSGWNWISTYIDLNEVDGMTLLKEALGDNAISIATQDDLADYDEEDGWIGLEDYELTNAEMVMVEMANACTITLAGPTVDPNTVEITINPGWNWIGYPIATETDIETALADFEAVDEDSFADKDGLSDYIEGDGWQGDVMTLVPGKGYMYYSNSDEEKTLIFSTTANGKSIILRKRKE